MTPMSIKFACHEIFGKYIFGRYRHVSNPHITQDEKLQVISKNTMFMLLILFYEMW